MQEGGSRPTLHPAFAPTNACFLPNALSLSRRLGKEDDADHSAHWDWNMSDYTTATGHDSEIVEITDPNQIRYWCHSLGCTEAQLRESVQAVGHSPGEVRQFLHDLSQRGVF
jgi:hypothetical protein